MSLEDLSKEEICALYQEQLMDAIEAHNCLKVHDIIHKEGVSPNFTFDGKAPLCKAAYFGYCDVLDILVEGGCDLNITNSDDMIWRRQAVHIAASKGHIEFMKQLLAHGADVNCRDDDQRTPLHWASTHGKTAMVECLLLNGSSIDMAQVDGFTPLHAATCLGHNRVCEVLLVSGAEINRTDRDGWTSFHTAVCYGHIDVVRTLIDAGASLSKVTNDDENAIHIAAGGGKLEVVKLLIEKGMAINEVNMNGFTALYLAVYYQEYEMTKHLLKIGANMYIPNGHRKTPFFLLAMRCLKDFMLLFIKAGYNLSSERWLLEKEFPIELQKLPELCNLLHKIAANPRRLKEICRIKLRSLIHYSSNSDFDTKFTYLNLPVDLNEFVSWKYF